MVLMTIGTVGICVFGVIYLIGHTIETVKVMLPKKKEKPEVEEPNTETETEPEIETDKPETEIEKTE